MRQKHALLLGISLTLTWLTFSVLMHGTVTEPTGDRTDYSQQSSLLRASDSMLRFVRTTAATSSEHKLCLVVPFRDRFSELMTFTPYMSKFLTAQGLRFELLIMQQIDGYRFNRASLINVGYYEAKRLSCDYIAMHDVDLLPLTMELRYSYPENRPKHIASPEYHPRYKYETFIGGILLINLEHFERVNGMSNRYWGWGMEDDEFYVRLRKANLLPDRQRNLSTNSNNTFFHLHSPLLRPRDFAKLYNQRNASRRLDRVSGVRTVQYKVQQRSKVTIEGYPLLVVNVILTCDKDFSPWCEFTRATHTDAQKTVRSTAKYAKVY